MAEQTQIEEIMPSDPEFEIVEVPGAERRTLFSEFGAYLMENKKWWMLPILFMVGIFGLVLLLGLANPALTPFIYTLF
jgi:hypothetical protein